MPPRTNDGVYTRFPGAGFNVVKAQHDDSVVVKRRVNANLRFIIVGDDTDYDTIMLFKINRRESD